MTALWAVAAFVVPPLAGIGLLRRRCEAREHWALHLGAGWLIGQLGVMVLTFAALAVTGASHARILLIVMALVALVAWRPRKRVGRSSIANRFAPSSDGRLFILLAAVIGASLLVKLYVVAQAQAWIPVRNDDAVRLWLYKAKQMAILDAPPPVEGDDSYLGGSNQHLPVFAVGAWTPLVVGHWSEPLAALPWMGMYVAIPLVLFGGLRRWLGRLPSLVAAYLMASLPLGVVHAYRPGYVDLLLAAYLAASVAYLLAWRSTHRLRHLVWGIVFAAACAAVKREGAVVGAVAVGAVLLTSRQALRSLPSWVRIALAAMFVVGIALLAVRFNPGDPTARFDEYRYHPGVVSAIVRHAFVWGSFNLLFWLIAAAMAFVLFAAKGEHRSTAVVLTVGLLGLDAMAMIFTPLSTFALNDQTPSRLFLQVLPAIVFALAIAAAGSPVDGTLEPSAATTDRMRTG